MMSPPPIAEAKVAIRHLHCPWTAVALLAAALGCFAGNECPRLMWDNTTFLQLEASLLPAGISSYGVQYPRLAQRTNGDLIVFAHSDTYQAGLYGGDLLCKRSLDGGLTWDAQWTVVRQQGPRTFAGTSIYALYANPCPTVLSSGVVLLASQVRNADPMTDQNTGTEVLLSYDNGVTWSGPYTAYLGMNWEPMVLETPTHLQMHFTKIATSPSSEIGVEMVRSYNGGRTWSADPETPFGHGRLISRSASTFAGGGWGGSGMADGMPVPLWMNNGAGILVAMESLGCSQAPQLVWSSAMSNWYYPSFTFGPMPRASGR